jgi:hypothetical protein
MRLDLQFPGLDFKKRDTSISTNGYASPALLVVIQPLPFQSGKALAVGLVY